MCFLLTRSEVAAEEQKRLERVDKIKRATMNSQMVHRLRVLNCDEKDIKKQQDEAVKVIFSLKSEVKYSVYTLCVYCSLIKHYQEGTAK